MTEEENIMQNIEKNLFKLKLIEHKKEMDKNKSDLEVYGYRVMKAFKCIKCGFVFEDEMLLAEHGIYCKSLKKIETNKSE